MLVKLLRRAGVRVDPQTPSAADWTECQMHTADVPTNGRARRCLVLRDLMAHPGTHAVLAELYQPSVAEVTVDQMVIRGVERVDDGHGRVAAVVQEWCVQLRPDLGPLGLQSPLAKGVRRTLHSRPSVDSQSGQKR